MAKTAKQFRACPQCSSWVSYVGFGPIPRCAPCKKIAAYDSMIRWQKANPDKVKSNWLKQRAKRDCHKEKERIKKWLDKNPDYYKQRRAKNPKYFLEKDTRFRANNPGISSFYKAAYVSAKKKSIPLWANLEKIKEIYKDASTKNLTVDHIIPLRGKTVCGLHVETNLQLVSLSDNSSKGNRYWPDMFDV